MKKQTEELVEKVKVDLKNEMSERRLNHSISVMEKAVELARIHGESEDDAAIAGIMHDIAKEISFEDSLEIAKNNGIEIDEIELINHKLIHGKIGAYLAKERYGVAEKIQKAIEYHTETNPEMDRLAKIIFIADKTEDTRKDEGDGIGEEREMSKIDLDKTIVMIIDGTIKKLINKGKIVHPTELITRNKLLMEMNKNDENI